MIFLDRYRLDFYGFIDSKGNMLSDWETMNYSFYLTFLYHVLMKTGIF